MSVRDEPAMSPPARSDTNAIAATTNANDSGSRSVAAATAISGNAAAAAAPRPPDATTIEPPKLIAARATTVVSSRDGSSVQASHPRMATENPSRNATPLVSIAGAVIPIATAATMSAPTASLAFRAARASPQRSLSITRHTVVVAVSLVIGARVDQWVDRDQPEAPPRSSPRPDDASPRPS